MAIEISTEGETQMITDGVEAGRARRADLPRSEHGRWQPAADRRDPVAILEEQGETRVEDLLPIRYQRMLVSPFTFYRGGAAIMAADLASQPNSGMIVQLCGDAHLSNFGVFASPDRRLVFSVNDFDETLPGPFEWDVKRLAASLAVAGRDLDILVSDRMDIVARCVGTYRRAILDLSGRPFLDLWYARIDEQAIVNRLDGRVSAKRRKEFDKNVAKAQAKDHLRALSKLTELVEGRPRFISDPPIIVPIEELAPGSDAAALNARWQEIFASYCESLPHDRRRLLQRFNYAHAARKVVGVGSVGTRAWIVLLTGRDGTDPLFLQFKEAQASVLEPFVDESEFENCGQRVVEGQRLMQAASDVMLGWIRTVGPDGVERDFYVRQLWDAKGSARVETMDSRTLAAYAELCGWALAEAHARSADVSAISGYLGTGESFDRSIASFAELYADRNDDDYQQFRRAAADGRVAVASA